MASVRETTLDLLRSLGMTTIFGNPGSTELPFLEDLPEDFTYVLGLQESVVLAMADGYAQAKRQATFVNLHTAPGLGNAMGAMVNAFHGHTPLVITAGQQDRRHLALEPLLHGRLVELARPYVKWSYEPVRAEDVPAAVARAYHTATQEPQGPVFVSIPMDDWEAEASTLETRRVSQRTAASPEALERVASALLESRQPAIVAGDGAARSAAWHEVVALAEKLDAPVYNEPLSAHAPFPQDHRLFHGHLASYPESALPAARRIRRGPGARRCGLQVLPLHGGSGLGAGDSRLPGNRRPERGRPGCDGDQRGRRRHPRRTAPLRAAARRGP